VPSRVGNRRACRARLATVSGSATRHRRQCGADASDVPRCPGTDPRLADLGAGAPGRARASEPAFDASGNVDVHRFPLPDRIVCRTPRAASLNVTSRSPTMSAPRACARPRPPGERPGVAEQVGKHVAQIREPPAVRRPAAAETCAKASGSKPSGMPSAPTGQTAAGRTRVASAGRKKRVRFVDFLEAFGLLLSPPWVRVILLGQLAVRLLDHVRVRVFGNAQDL